MPCEVREEARASPTGSIALHEGSRLANRTAAAAPGSSSGPGTVDIELAAPNRLRLIARLGLTGHVGDPELDAVVAALLAGCRAPIAFINVVTPDRQTYAAEAGVGVAWTQVPDALSFCTEVVTTARALQVPDARNHPVYGGNPFVVAGKVGAYAGEPLVHEGAVVGAVAICDALPRRFTDAELQVLRAQARLVGAVIGLRAAAACDRVTGLATRALLLDRVEQICRNERQSGERGALLVLDIAGMVAINEEEGPAGGDHVLRTIAARLGGACGLTESAARIGGDRFAVVFSGVASDEDARLRADAIVAAASQPVTIAGRVIPVGLHRGLAITSGDTTETLLATAERLAKERLHPTRLPPRPPAQHPRRVEELRQAIQTEQFVLHYHPVVDMDARRVVGVEALVRWQHPQRGLLPPSEFVPLAEAEGLIEELGEWILRAGVAQAATWRARGRQLEVAVNLSPLQMAGATFAARVAEVLQEVGLPARQILLEVTESAVVDQPHVIETLQVLRESGVRLALDDFGTGYSSLSYLRRFPIDVLKIDRSFVSGLGRNRDDEAIVASVVSLAHNTGKAVIAEGVETVEHAERLRLLGVRHAQGFLWTPPLAAEQLASWVDAFEDAHPIPGMRRVPKPALIDIELPGMDRGGEKILLMHAAGASAHTIAAALNREGYRTGAGVRWHAKSVAALLPSSRQRGRRKIS